MKKMMFAKAAVFLLLFAGLTAGASAQVTISGGFALSQLDASGAALKETGFDGGIGYGGNIYADYLLPISIPLSLGVEVGIDTAELDSSVNDKILSIPILVRAAYHFDLMPKLDLYVVGKIGWSFGSWEGDAKDKIKAAGIDLTVQSGFAFGFDVGAAYYFTSTIGAFAEAGFDRYDLSAKASGGGESDTVKAPFNRFFTLGISTKF
jgi:hypothetical protein